MKKFILILGLVINFACATKVDYCETRHPHDGKMVVDIDWTTVAYSQNITPPQSIILYLWNENSNQTPLIYEGSSYEFICDLPPAGSYKALMMTKLQNKVAATGFESYNSAKIVVPQQLESNQPVIGEAELVYIVDLGTINVNNTQALFIQAKALQCARKMNVNIAMDNAYLLAKSAYIKISDIAPDVLLNQNKPLYSALLRVPLDIKAHALQTQIYYFGVADKQTPKVNFSLVINPNTGYTCEQTIDITTQITNYEKYYPEKVQPLILDAEITTNNTNGGFAFKFGSVNVNNEEVNRGGNAE